MRSKKRKHRKYPNRAIQTLQKWMKDGCPSNVKHFYTMLSAEQAALDKKYKLAETLYKKAIVMAARPGLLSNSALFSERYSDFLKQSGPYFHDLEDEAS